MVNWNSKTLYDRITDRWAERESQYSTLNRNRELIISYFRSDEYADYAEQENTGGEGRNMDLLGENIYQGSSAWYPRMMATGFQGSLVSKNIDWTRYEMGDIKLRGIDPLDQWMQDIKDYMTDVYNRSNFYDVQPQFTLDGLTVGSPVMFAEEDILNQRTMWTPQYYKNIRVYYDRYNQPEGVIVRDKKWTAKQIFDEFVGHDDEEHTRSKAMLSIEVNKALESGKLNQEFTVYRAVFKVDDPIWEGSDEKGFKKPAGQWEWLSVYMLELSDRDQDKKDKPLNTNMGYFSQPFVLWDFEKKPWEAASRTPAWYAVWDSLGLQQVYKQFLENGQLKNRPPRIALDSMKGRMSLSPEGEMYVDAKEYDRSPKALDMIGDIQLNGEIAGLYEDALKRWFFIDKFEMFSALSGSGGSPPTATQIWQMAGEKATLLSPAIETHSTYLRIADARMIDIESRAGRGPFSPERMEEITDIVQNNSTTFVSGVDVQPVFIGPLARAQKQTQAMEPVESTLAFLGNMMEVNPDLRHAIRWYETATDIADELNFPQKNIVPKEEYDAIIEAINAQKAQMLQQQQAIEMAKASKDVSGPVDPTSVLAKTGEAI